MANNATVAHRFCNKDFGKYGTLHGSSTHIDGRNYYSYSTKFGQWVDMEKNVCIIYEGSTSVSSSKHQLDKRMFPDGVHVFPYDDGGNRGYYCGGYYHGCNLVGWLNNDEDFTYSHRIELLDYYVREMYAQFKNITESKGKGAEHIDFKYWGYFEELCGLYKDISVSKYLCSLKGRDAETKAKRKMVKLLAQGVTDVQTITDEMYGDGTFKQYWDYCARYRKSEQKRKHVENICKYLVIASPYEKWAYGRLEHDMTAEEIRKLTPPERLAWKWKALRHKQYRDTYEERNEKYNKNMVNAYKWIVGREPKVESSWYNRASNEVTTCTNMHTGEMYVCGGRYIYGVYFAETSIDFKYDEFRKSEDKSAWIADFYAKCAEVARTRLAVTILQNKGVLATKTNRWEDDKYLFNDEFVSRCNDKVELALCKDYIEKQDRYYHDKELRERAQRLERERKRAEEEKERIFREQAKKERIDQLLAEGVTGIQSMWREHLTSIETASDFFHETAFADEPETMLYDGGNVLLRFDLDKKRVETSKGVSISIDVCKAMWKYVKAWHENPASFKEYEINTRISGSYTISSYEHDILTAGCHKIAFSEMERMYNEIMSIAA